MRLECTRMLVKALSASLTSVPRTTQAILHDYPGGQLLDEALQNAEDSGATSFALVLDLRQHAGVDARLAGPAFVLIDNGRGLGEREWTSLQNLNRSEKRECVRVTPRFTTCIAFRSCALTDYFCLTSLQLAKRDRPVWHGIALLLPLWRRYRCHQPRQIRWTGPTGDCHNSGKGWRRMVRAYRVLMERSPC